MPFAPTILEYLSNIVFKKIFKKCKKLDLSPHLCQQHMIQLSQDIKTLKLHLMILMDQLERKYFFKKNNPSYYELIEKFTKISNCGALLNTSYNLHGSPIVKNLNDALLVLDNSGLDGLITKNFLILKKTKN